MDEVLFQKIKFCTSKDKAETPFEYLCYTLEASGEVSRCLIENADLKPKRIAENVMSEIADVIISITALYSKLGGDYEELGLHLANKVRKWEDKLERKVGF